VQLALHGAFFVWLDSFFCVLSRQMPEFSRMSYFQLATWLTAQRYPTKADELKNAKRASLVDGV